MNAIDVAAALNWVSKLSEAGQLVASLLLALTLACSALSALLGFLGAFWPPAMAGAKRCSDVGFRLHNWGERLGRLTRRGGSTFVLAIAMSVGAAGSAVVLPGCGGWWQKHEAEVVNDSEQLAAEDIACVLQNMPLGPEGAALACGLQSLPTVLDDIRKLFAGQPIAVRRAGASHLELRARARRDAGPADAH